VKIKVNPHSATPVYGQMIATIIKAIEANQLGSGDMLHEARARRIGEQDFIHFLKARTIK
jgi:DNA-binding transcriptional regulator YhcF (GntR family)